MARDRAEVLLTLGLPDLYTWAGFLRPSMHGGSRVSSRVREQLERFSTAVCQSTAPPPSILLCVVSTLPFAETFMIACLT